MMLKGVETMRAAQASKPGMAVPVRKSALVAARAPVSKRHQAFKAARLAVAARAAAEDSRGPTATRAAKKPLSEVAVGEEYEGRIVGVEQFGAFVDFGFAQNGLVHISQLSDKYVKSAASEVSVNQTVRVRVMSVDTAANRVALSMKGLAKEENEEDADAVEEEVEEDLNLDEVSAEAAEEEDDVFELPAGYEAVSAPEAPELSFIMAQEDDEMTFESVAAFEALDPETVERELISDDFPVPVGELISGKVTRVEDYGVFVQFSHGGRTGLTALLERDEAKVPAAALTAAQRAEFGDDVPEYADVDFYSIKDVYKIGDEVSAFTLAYNERGQLSLTQFADWELQEAVAGLDDGEATTLLAKEELDALAEDPLALIDDGAFSGAAQEDDDPEDASVEGGLRAEYALTGYGRPLLSSDINLTFPSRPLNAANRLALNQGLGLSDTDFDGDEVVLEDFWQQSIPVPKAALKRLGLKIELDAAGEPRVVEREGAPKGEWDAARALQASSHNARVAAFVKDLLADDEDEAELPARAMRRPVAFAAAVTNISAAAVKQLRDKTGAGMMDCKKALIENAGDTDKAIEWLRKKGLSGADKKAGRVAAEGVIHSYIHPGSRLGVLLEVNCETDFVAASDKFTSLVSAVAMQIAASPTVAYVTADEIPPEVWAREKEIEMGREDLKSKPDAIKAKIAEGRVAKLVAEMALLPQPYLLDPSKTVEQAVKEAIAELGEKISVRRFVRFQLGEGIEKKATNLAAEVAAATGQA